MTHGNHQVDYGYLTNSGLANRLTFAHGGTNVMATVKEIDLLNRLKSTTTTNVAGQALARFDYRYNEVNQRIQTTLKDESRWDYGYDDLGQVTQGKKTWSGGVPVAGQQYEYAFDSIGNRLQTKTGGEGQSNLQKDFYTPAFGVSVGDKSL